MSELPTAAPPVNPSATPLDAIPATQFMPGQSFAPGSEPGAGATVVQQFSEQAAAPPSVSQTPPPIQNVQPQQQTQTTPPVQHVPQPQQQYQPPQTQPSTPVSSPDAVQPSPAPPPVQEVYQTVTSPPALSGTPVSANPISAQPDLSPTPPLSTANHHPIKMYSQSTQTVKSVARNNRVVYFITFGVLFALIGMIYGYWISVGSPTTLEQFPLVQYFLTRT